MFHFELTYQEIVGLLAAIVIWTVMLVTFKKGILSSRHFIRLGILCLFVIALTLILLFLSFQPEWVTFAGIVIPIIWGFVDSLVPDIVEAQKRVVLILKSETPYNVVFAKSIQAELKSRLPKVELETFFCTRGENLNDQEAIFRREMAKKPDVIVVVPTPHNAQLARCAVKAIKDSIVVITVDDILDQMEFTINKLFPPLHIATNFDTGGRLAARAMLRALNGKGNVVILSGPQDSSPSQVRKLAFMDEILLSAQDVVVVAARSTSWNANEAENHIIDLLKAKIAIDGVFCCNDTLAMGALHAFKEMKSQVNNICLPVIIGFDGTKDVEQFIINQEIYASINVGVEAQGQLVFDQLVVILRNKRKHLKEAHAQLFTKPTLLSRETLVTRRL